MSKQNGTRLTNDKGLTRIAFDELKKKGSANFRRCRDRDVAPFRQSIQKKIWTKDLRSFSLWRKTAEVLFFACSTVHSHRWPHEDNAKKRHFMTKEDSNNYVFKKKKCIHLGRRFSVCCCVLSPTSSVQSEYSLDSLLIRVNSQWKITKVTHQT